MRKVSTEKIKIAVKELCSKVAVNLDRKTYELILKAYKKELNKKSKSVLAKILKNAQLAHQKQRPLCQDTGQVVVFVEIGQGVQLEGMDFKAAVNQGVSESFKENYLRKSVVKNPLNRENTADNTPAIIHSKIVAGDEVNITLGLKGGGAENMSAVSMMSPSKGKDGIIEFVKETVQKASMKACPPIVLGVGVGGNFETCAINAKKALFLDKEKTEFEKELLKELNSLNIGASGEGGQTTVLDLNVLEAPCHIASMPVAVNLNCHSSRHARAIIGDEIVYDFGKYDYCFEQIDGGSEAKEVSTSDVESIKNLKKGEEILLTGTVYTARDEAHKRFLAEKNKPFDIKNSIIFYAGPCPSKPDEAIGPIGPTTSIRMDKYLDEMLNLGLLATIGKGERENNNGIYLTATGGVATLLAQCVKSSELIAYEDLGPEAIYKLEVEKLPLYVACGKIT